MPLRLCRASDSCSALDNAGKHAAILRRVVAAERFGITAKSQPRPPPIQCNNRSGSTDVSFRKPRATRKPSRLRSVGEASFGEIESVILGSLALSRRRIKVSMQGDCRIYRIDAPSPCLAFLFKRRRWVFLRLVAPKSCHRPKTSLVDNSLRIKDN